MFDVKMLIEVVGMISILAGFIASAYACLWSARTLKEKTGSVFNLSMITGFFAFYNLFIKIHNGNAALRNYIIGLIALVFVALDVMAVYEEHGAKTAVARALSALYGALIVVAVLGFFADTGGKTKKRDD